MSHTPLVLEAREPGNFRSEHRCVVIVVVDFVDDILKEFVLIVWCMIGCLVCKHPPGLKSQGIQKRARCVCVHTYKDVCMTQPIVPIQIQTKHTYKDARMTQPIVSMHIQTKQLGYKRSLAARDFGLLNGIHTKNF